MSAPIFYVADGVNLVEHRASDGRPLRSVPLKWFMATREMVELLREELTFDEPPPELPGSYRARVRALLARIDAP